MEFVNEFEETDVILVGFPVDQGTENKGCINAPAKVREQFERFYLSESGKTNRILDKGDIVEEESFEQTMDKVYNKILEFLEFQKPIISIGGNHSITFPIMKAFTKHYDNIGLVFVDAHPDCQANYFPYGDVIGQISQLEEVRKIFLIGIRNWSKDEKQFLEENKIPFIQMKDIINVSDIIKKVKEEMKDCDSVYISFDIDAIDPAFAPGTGCIEPGGLSSRQAIHLIRDLSALPNIVGFDLVEINPKKDINEITSSLGAKLIFEFVNSR